MGDRLSSEREADIRYDLAHHMCGDKSAMDLLAEIDALRADLTASQAQVAAAFQVAAQYCEDAERTWSKPSGNTTVAMAFHQAAHDIRRQADSTALAAPIATEPDWDIETAKDIWKRIRGVFACEGATRREEINEIMAHPEQPIAPEPVCAQCGQSKDNSEFHLEAPEPNWMTELHHFLPVAPEPAPHDYIESYGEDDKPLGECDRCSKDKLDVIHSPTQPSASDAAVRQVREAEARLDPVILRQAWLDTPGQPTRGPAYWKDFAERIATLTRAAEETKQ